MNYNNRKITKILIVYSFLLSFVLADNRELLAIPGGTNVKSSAWCKNECIDKTYNFCPTNT